MAKWRVVGMAGWIFGRQRNFDGIWKTKRMKIEGKGLGNGNLSASGQARLMEACTELYGKLIFPLPRQQRSWALK